MPVSARALLSITALAVAACGDGAGDVVGPDVHPGPESFETVSAGYAHTCGLAEEGIAYCWGSNVGGALGDGTTVDRLVPTEVTGGHRFASIDVDEYNTCGLRTDGRALCWGVDPLSLRAGAIRYDSLPREVPGGMVFGTLTVGTLHTCALDGDGAAWCWGVNEDGQLGDGTTIGREAPTAVGGGHRFQALAAGEASCGVDLEGTVYCWGRGRTDCPCTFVPQVAAASHAFVAITVGGHACGLDETGAAFCWGENIWGQIGDGSNANRPEPVPVAGDLRFTEISAARFSTCAVDGGGDAYCWGANPFGQIGDGTSANETAVPVPVSGGTRFRSVSAGVNHTCALDESGDVWCWGWNAYGQLGDGTSEDRWVPRAVARGGSVTT